MFVHTGGRKAEEYPFFFKSGSAHERLALYLDQLSNPEASVAVMRWWKM